jgi:hypothetical protein
VFLNKEEKQQFLWGFLNRLSAALPQAAVVQLPNEKCTDLRVTLEGFPVRLRCAWDPFAMPHIEAKVPNPLGLITLKFDPEVRQELQAAPDPTWGDTVKPRVFFGPCVFTFGDRAESDASQLMQLPQELRWALAGAMVQARLDHYQMRADGIWVDTYDDVYQMPDAERMFAYLLSLVGWNAKVLAWLGSQQHAPGAPAHRARASMQLVQCRYCHAKFFLEQDTRCRNCGAAFGT